MSLTADAFAEHRRLLFSIAYRMTGSAGDADDLVQEAFLRLERARQDGAAIDEPRAWLAAVTTRLAIDHLRSARVRRESYVGPWLPEPLLADEAPGPDEHAEMADSLSQAFLVLLETLSPVERAVFLLREVFGYDYGEVAGLVGRREDHCRQILARARRRVEDGRPRFTPDRRRRAELLERFLAASDRGDVTALEELLAEDVVLYSDGGGKANAARRPILGAAKVIRLMTSIARKRRDATVRRLAVNGEPGAAVVAADGTLTDVLTIDVAEDRIRAVYIVRNPDKLARAAPVADARAPGLH